MNKIKRTLFLELALVGLIAPVVPVYAAAEEDAKESEAVLQERLTPAQKRERLTDEERRQLDDLLVQIFERYRRRRIGEDSTRLLNDMRQALEDGADSNVQVGWGGLSVLDVACQEDLSEIVDLLIRYQADTNGARDENGNGFTPLMHASYKGRLAVVRQLLENKALVDVCTQDGEDVLTNALEGALDSALDGMDINDYKAAEDIVKMLVFAGAGYGSYSKWWNLPVYGRSDAKSDEEENICTDLENVIKEVQQVREGLGGQDGQNWSLGRLRESGVLAFFVPVRVLEELILDLTDHHTGDPFIDNLIDELLEQRAVEISQKEAARQAHIHIVEIPKEREKVSVRAVTTVEADEEHKEDGERQDGIECPACTFINGITQQSCSMCGKSFEDEPHFYDA